MKLKKERKSKQKRAKTKEEKRYSRSQILVKIMAAILVVFMAGGSAITLIYALAFR